MKNTDAQLALQNALITLFHDNPDKKISIMALCQTAHVARSTFYAYYDNLNELLTEIEDKIVKEISDLDDQIVDRNIIQAEDLAYFSKLMSYIKEHAYVIETLPVIKPDIILINKWQDAIKKHLFKRRQGNFSQKFKLEADVLSAGALNGFIYLLKHPQEVSDKDVINVVSANIRVLDNL